MILLSSLVSSEQIGYKIIYSNQVMDVNQLFDSLKGEFETISVATCDHTDIEARLNALEAMLNVTIPEPELKEIWTCEDKPGVTYEQNECQPKNDQRRCYYAIVFYHYCKTGWVLQ